MVKKIIKYVITVLLVFVVFFSFSVSIFAGGDNYSVYSSEAALGRDSLITYDNLSFEIIPPANSTGYYSGFDSDDIFYLQLPNGRPMYTDDLPNGQYGGLSSSGTQIAFGEGAQYRYYLSTSNDVNQDAILYEYGIDYALPSGSYDPSLIPDTLAYQFQFNIDSFSIDLSDPTEFDSVRYMIDTQAPVDSITVTYSLTIMYPKTYVSGGWFNYEIARSPYFEQIAVSPGNSFNIIPPGFLNTFTSSSDQIVSGYINIIVKLKDDYIDDRIYLYSWVDRNGDNKDGFFGGEWNAKAEYNTSPDYPSSGDLPDLLGWLIDSVDGFMDTDVFFNLSFGDILWFVIGISLLFAVLRMFVG